MKYVLETKNQGIFYQTPLFSVDVLVSRARKFTLSKTNKGKFV